MGLDFALLTGLLALLWFLAYWVFGGVAMALFALLRSGRVRRVRFGCLFSLWALAVGVGAAYMGVQSSQGAVTACLEEAGNRAEVISAIFGCGFVGIMGGFGLGFAAVFLGGLLIMALSARRMPRMSEPSSPVAPPVESEIL